MTRFTGKTVIVTGAGIGDGGRDHRGASMTRARTSSSSGAPRKHCARRPSGFDQDRVAIHVGDVADAAVGEGAVALAVDRFGALDVLVNNAATAMIGDIEATASRRLRPDHRDQRARLCRDGEGGDARVARDEGVDRHDLVRLGPRRRLGHVRV